MRYNPKARLSQDQVEFKRSRASGHTFADRFSDKDRNNGSKMDRLLRSESASGNYYRNAMRQRLRQRGEWLG